MTIHNPAVDVAKLKQQDGPDLLTQGSSVLIQTLLKNDLIDQINLLVFPLVLGSGKRFFGEGARAYWRSSSKGRRTSPSGVTLNTLHTSRSGQDPDRLRWRNRRTRS